MATETLDRGMGPGGDLPPGPSLFGLVEFDPTVDAAAFLTFLALVAGFLGWAFKAIKEWRRDSAREAESGALRLLLKILREHRGQPVSPAGLRRDFELPGRADERRAYCGRDYRFKTDSDFDRAIYQLHWESKIDFTRRDEVVFRTRFEDRLSEPPPPPDVDRDTLLDALRHDLGDPQSASHQTDALVRLGMHVDPEATRQLLEDALSSTHEPDERRSLLSLVSHMIR
jgi:hypothetical protein